MQGDQCHEETKLRTAPVSTKSDGGRIRLPMLFPYSADPKLQHLLSEFYLAGYLAGRQSVQRESSEARIS